MTCRNQTFRSTPSLKLNYAMFKVLSSLWFQVSSCCVCKFIQIVKTFNTTKCLQPIFKESNKARKDNFSACWPRPNASHCRTWHHLCTTCSIDIGQIVDRRLLVDRLSTYRLFSLLQPIIRRWSKPSFRAHRPFSHSSVPPKGLLRQTTSSFSFFEVILGLHQW